VRFTADGPEHFCHNLVEFGCTTKLETLVRGPGASMRNDGRFAVGRGLMRKVTRKGGTRG